MLWVSNLNVYRGKTQVLKDVSLEVARGEIFALVGSNGAGKSSLLMALSGLLPIKSGTAKFHSAGGIVSLAHYKPEKIVALGLVHCPEGRQIFIQMTVEENLRLGAYLNDNANQINWQLEQAYALFPILQERRKFKAGTLSGGEQMMLSLARSLMSQPNLLLLDEPSLGLAPQITEQLFKKLDELNKNQNITIIIVEQNATMALELADNGGILADGKIVTTAIAEVLLHDQQVVSAYFGL